MEISPKADYSGYSSQESVDSRSYRVKLIHIRVTKLTANSIRGHVEQGSL